MRAVTRNFGRNGHRDDPRVVLAAAIVIVGMAMGTMFALGVFLRPMQDDLAWGRAEISGVALVTWSMLGIGSFGWGVLSDRVGVRAVVVAGGLQLGLGLILASQASALWHFYVAFGGVAGLAVGAFYAPLTAMAAQWFQANRGLAVALVSAGSGVGAFVVAPVARWLITLYGWRIAMLMVGDLVWLVIVPLGLIVRNRTKSGLQASQESNENAGLPLRQILRVPLFWLIAFTHFACCVAHSGPIFHMVAYAMDLGASKMTAATIFGLSSLASVAGRIGSGMVADRYRPGPTLVPFLSIQVPAILLYLVVQSPLSFYALGILFGLAYGGVMPLYALLTREYFGGRAMGGAYGIVFMLQAIGMGLGAYAGGWFYDHMGGYAWSFAAAGTIGVTAVSMAWTLRAPLAVRLTAPA